MFLPFAASSSDQMMTDPSVEALAISMPSKAAAEGVKTTELTHAACPESQSYT